MSILFRRLALGGGGVKGILHVGALQELSKIQPLEFPDGVYGSSIGSIIATYVAFGLPIDKTIPLLKKYLVLNKIVPKPNFTHVARSLSSKGMFDMDMFETLLIEMFNEVGLDIKDKKLGDAKMPLYIVSSNITKGTPAIFSKDVPIISALKCSCCIPAVFKPQSLYGQLYIDGDIFSPSISKIIPKDKNTLVIILKKQYPTLMTPQNLEEISPLKFIENVYLMTLFHFYNAQKDDSSLILFYPNLHSTSLIEEVDVEDVLNKSRSDLRRFLIKNGLYESLEVGSSRVS